MVGTLFLGVLTGCRTVERDDPRILRAEASTRAESWEDAASLWSQIYRASSGEDRRAGIESARALAASGRPGVARSRLAEMAARWPDDAEVQELLGHAHERVGDASAALEAYLRALELEPGRPHAVARSSLLAEDLGVPDAGPASAGDSLATLRAAGGLAELDVDSLRALGLRSAAAGRFDEAYSALQNAVSSGQLTVAQRIEAAAALAPDPRTIPWLTAIVRDDPLHTRALTLLGSAQLSAGYQARAVATLEQAASSDPGDEAALRAFAEALTQTGQAGRARTILDLVDGN